MGVVLNIHSSKMKVLASLFLAVGLASAEWTCEECEEAHDALSAYTTSEEAIAGQVDVLVGVICPETEDPDFCTENLPAFWEQSPRKYLENTGITFVMILRSALTTLTPLLHRILLLRPLLLSAVSVLEELARLLTTLRKIMYRE